MITIGLIQEQENNVKVNKIMPRVADYPLMHNPPVSTGSSTLKTGLSILHSQLLASHRSKRSGGQSWSTSWSRNVTTRYMTGDSPSQRVQSIRCWKPGSETANLHHLTSFARCTSSIEFIWTYLSSIHSPKRLRWRGRLRWRRSVRTERRGLKSCRCWIAGHMAF